MIVPINPEEQGSRYRHPTWKSYFTYPCLHLLYPSSRLSMSIPVPPLSSSPLFLLPLVAAFLFPLPSILLFFSLILPVISCLLLFCTFLLLVSSLVLPRLFFSRFLSSSLFFYSRPVISSLPDFTMFLEAASFNIRPER